MEDAEVFSINISLTFEMNIHCPSSHSCGSIFYPYPSNWISLYECLQRLKRKKKTPQGCMGNSSCWKCFYRCLIKGRKSLAAFQATSCKVGHKTSCNFQSHIVFFSGIFGCIIKRLPFLIFAPYAAFCPSFCMRSWLKACLVPSESFKRKKKKKS